MTLSILVLSLCGYHTYVIFQYTRITALVTAAGLILLFYSLDYAVKKNEKYVSFFIGIVLTVLGSLLRFQMFAVTVVLIGSVIGLNVALKCFRKKKNIRGYVVAFGITCLLCCVFYGVDKLSYTTNNEWATYQAFNEARMELWDYGFPEYNENRHYFEKIGISESDYNFYKTWNMDEEVLTVESIQQIEQLKNPKEFELIEFFKIFPKAFKKNDVFWMFLFLAIVMILINWKISFFPVLLFFIVMIFEAYLYYQGRWGIARVDYGIWIAASLGLIYNLLDRFANVHQEKVRYKLIAIVGIGVLLWGNFTPNPTIIDGETSESKEFYREIIKDKEHLYVVLESAPRVYYSFEFWEPSELNELSNIYNAYGWEFNTPTKKHILDQYNIENIYRDSIDNSKVYFVVGDGQKEMLLTYISENYDERAVLVYEKEIDGIDILSIKTK